MDEAPPTTVIIQRYLDAVPGDAAQPTVRKLLERAVSRLRLLCARFLYKSYPCALRSAPRPPHLHRNRTSANLLRTHRPRCVGPLSATHFDLATSGDGTEAGNILGRDGADRRGCSGPK